jgi:hypothetical protein
MPTHNLSKLLKGKKAQSYQGKRNTAGLLQAVISARTGRLLSGDDIWHLIRLTWLTAADDHWRKLKIEALRQLFPQAKKIQRLSRATSLQDALNQLVLPKNVQEAAAKNTGIVNFRGTWRNSSRAWCKQNVAELRDIIRQAIHLRQNDAERLALAGKIDSLPKIASPSRIANASPGNFLTPLVACLDPHRRFPIVNGRKAVQALLGKLGLRGRNVDEQVRGMTGLIGRFGIADTFVLDALADEVTKVANRINVPAKSPIKSPAKSPVPHAGSELPDYDASERQYLQEAGTHRYRNRHNKMTTALKNLLPKFKLTQGTNPECRWDALVECYDTTGRDLLLEVKPDGTKAAIRIAIGQLLDYRRFVRHPAATDIAVVTIGRPDGLYRHLLLDLQISAIWFADKRCLALDGEGPGWEALQKALAKPEADPAKKLKAKSAHA